MSLGSGINGSYHDMIHVLARRRTNRAVHLSQLSVKNGQPLITAESEWGILRGLETLVQIAEVVNDKIGIYDQEITDQPTFPYRGLLLDTSRHFIPISVIKSLITALSLVFRLIFSHFGSQNLGKNRYCPTRFENQYKAGTK